MKLLSQDKQNRANDNELNNINVRWFSIFTSPIFLGILLTKISYGVVFDFVSQKVPAYLQDVIGLPVDENGLSFSFIMIGYCCTLLSGGAIADTIIANTKIATATVRKLFQLLSGLIMIVAFSMILNVGQSKWTNILALALVMLGYGFTSGGDLPAVVDISGPISGTVFALMNTLCSISGFAVPYLVGIVIESEPTSSHLWRYLFITGAIIISVGMLSFLLFASSKLQHNWFEQAPEPAPPPFLEEKEPLLQMDYKMDALLEVMKSSTRYETFPSEHTRHPHQIIPMHKPL